MKKIFLLFLLGGLISACTQKELTDEELLAKDKAELESRLDSESVTLYKFIKMVLRSSNDPAFAKHVGKHDKEFRLMTKLFKKMEAHKELSASEYLDIATSLKAVRGYVKSTDEDIFPALLEAIKLQKNKKIRLTTGKAKDVMDSEAHVLMCLFSRFGGGFGKSEILYECSEIQTDDFADSENKTYLQFFKGYIYYENGLMYLSEHEYTRNIEWISSSNANYQSLNQLFGRNHFTKKQSKDFVLAFNYLMRGCVRMSMEREIDQERSLEDLEKFVELTKGMIEFKDVRLIVQAYIHVKKGENDKAIATLKTLQSSSTFNASEKEYIGKVISALEAGESAEDSGFDGQFIGEIASGALNGKLEKVEWKKEAKKHHMTYLNSVFESMETIESGMSKAKDGASKTGKSLKEKGGEFWEDAKKLVD